MSSEKVTNHTEESEDTSVKNESSNNKSEETQMSDEKIEKESVTSDEESGTNDEESAEKQATPDEQIQELNDRYLRLYSEFENFRRRTAKEKLDLISNASRQVLGDLLPIIDDLERAIKNNAEVQDAESVKEGIQLIHSKLDNTLKSKGLKEIDAQGKEFDLDFHEAVTKIPAPSDDLKGKVVDVIEKGFMLNDKVLRYAKVVVGE